MSKLEDLRPNASVRGVLPDELVTVVNVQWFGSAAIELTYKTATGRVANELLYRHDEPRIEVVEIGRPWSFDGDGGLFRLVSERRPPRFHASVRLDPTRLGRDAGRVADEVVAHLAGLVGSEVGVTSEIEAEMPEGAPENVVRTVPKNCRTLKFKTAGFEDQ